MQNICTLSNHHSHIIHNYVHALQKSNFIPICTVRIMVNIHELIPMTKPNQHTSVVYAIYCSYRVSTAPSGTHTQFG